ncbi:MAG: glycerate kinase type-2 family protein [Candidatus Njordarchaeales archaeon]
MFVKNYEELLASARNDKDKQAREIILQALEAALIAVDPRHTVKRNVMISDNKLVIAGKEFDLDKIRNIYVIGGGKASGAMAEAMEEVLGDRISGGVVNVLKGTEKNFRVQRIKLVGASHPIPDENGMHGVEEMLEIAKRADEDDLVIVLISGGGSALMPKPAEPITLEEMKITTDLLLKCGATINEINAVRKHISAFKGGQLARACYPATTVALVISDVVGDPLDTIASGPTAPDTTTFEDAYRVLKFYGILDKVPENVRKRIEKGLKGEIPETPKPGDKIFEKVHNIIIANNRIACEAAEAKAREMGVNTLILSTHIEGEARHVGTVLAGIAREIHKYDKPLKRPALIIMGGETTVTVTGTGKGGRNQELSLSASLRIRGLEGTAIASVGTDGIDGITDAAGGLVDSTTVDRGKGKGLDVLEYLANNDSYTFLKAVGDVIFTGPTGSNVNDIMFVAVV